MKLLSPTKFVTFFQLQHPLVAHKLAYLRDKNTDSKQFKELTHEITLLLASAATQNLSLQKTTVDTPLEKTSAAILTKEKPVILPILRAGLGMVDALFALMPFADIGHIGLARNETTLKTDCYYFKIPPNSENRPFFICDPMLATGGSACDAISRLQEHGIHNITFICLVAAPEGVEKLCGTFPNIPVFAANLDEKLNEHGYILPGLGDAGDRLFGTI